MPTHDEQNPYLNCRAKAKHWDNGGVSIDVSCTPEALVAWAALVSLKPNERGYVEFTIGEKKTPGKFGETHYIKFREPRRDGSR